MKTVKFCNFQKAFEGDMLIIPIANQEDPSFFQEIDQSLKDEIGAAFKQMSFQRTFGEICLLTTNGKFAIPRLLFIGINGGSPLEVQCLGGKIAAHICDAKRIAIYEDNDFSFSLLFGLVLRFMPPPSYKTGFVPKVKEWLHISTSPEEMRRLFQPFQDMLESVALARWLTVAPANKLNPQQFAEKCLALKSLGLDVAVLDKEALHQEGLHAILAVGKGSSNAPYLVTLQWKGAQSAPIAFVGKGVCFDAGGINIKTEELPDMKWDKAGAAAVVALMHLLAKTKAPVNAVGVIGLVENMVDGSSMKPGDIIDTHSGLTVEVVDTDNEGRLVLCDCLSYAQKISLPTTIIDLGTLTLETMGALAGEYAGLYCNDQVLSSQLIKAGEESGEKLWPLPLGKSFAKQIESEEADLKNCGIFGFGEGGASAEFLKAFVKTGVKWAHLDIAGVAWHKEDQDCSPKGVTGFGVQLLYRFVEQLVSLQKK